MKRRNPNPLSPFFVSVSLSMTALSLLFLFGSLSGCSGSVVVPAYVNIGGMAPAATPDGKCTPKNANFAAM